MLHEAQWWPYAGNELGAEWRSSDAVSNSHLRSSALHSTEETDTRPSVAVLLRLKPQLKRVPKVYLPYHIQVTSGPWRGQGPPTTPTTSSSCLTNFFTTPNNSDKQFLSLVDPTLAFPPPGSPPGRSGSPRVQTSYLTLTPPTPIGSGAAATPSSSGAAPFGFDQILDASDSDDRLCAELIPLLLQRARYGLHSTVLLHGPSGSGKSHGLNVIASALAQGLFTTLLQPDQGIVELSYLQLYENQAYHLVGPAGSTTQLGIPLPAPHDSAAPSCVFFPKVVVKSVKEVQERMKAAEALKCTTSHELNARSSCSDVILVFSVTRLWKGVPVLSTRIALIDVASSESTSLHSSPAVGGAALGRSPATELSALPFHHYLTAVVEGQSTPPWEGAAHSRWSIFTAYLQHLITGPDTLVVLFLFAYLEIAFYQDTVELLQFGHEIRQKRDASESQPNVGASHPPVPPNATRRAALNRKTAAGRRRCSPSPSATAGLPSGRYTPQLLLGDPGAVHATSGFAPPLIESVELLQGELENLERAVAMERLLLTTGPPVPQCHTETAIPGASALLALERERYLVSAAKEFLERELRRVAPPLGGGGASTAPPAVLAQSSSAAPNEPSATVGVLSLAEERAEAYELLKQCQTMASSSRTGASGHSRLHSSAGELVGAVYRDPQQLLEAEDPFGLCESHLKRVSAYMLRSDALLEASLEEKAIRQLLLRSLRCAHDQRAEELLQTKQRLVEANKEICRLLAVHEEAQQTQWRLLSQLDEMEMNWYRECSGQAVRQDTLLLFHRKQSLHLQERKALLRELGTHRKKTEALQQRLSALEREMDVCIQQRNHTESEVRRRDEAFKAVWKLLSPHQKARFNDYGSLSASSPSDAAAGAVPLSAGNSGSPLLGGSGPGKSSSSTLGTGGTAAGAGPASSLVLSHDLIVVNAQLRETQRQLEQAMVCARERDGAIEDLKEEVRHLVKNVARRDTQAARQAQELDALREYVHQMEGQLVEAVVHSHRQVAKLRVFKEEIQGLQESNQRLETEQEEYRSESLRLNNLVVSLRLNMEQQSGEMALLTEHIQRINTERAKQNYHRQLYYESRIKELEKQILLLEKRCGKAAKRAGMRGSAGDPSPTGGGGATPSLAAAGRGEPERKRRMRSAVPLLRGLTGGAAAAGGGMRARMSSARRSKKRVLIASRSGGGRRAAGQAAAGSSTSTTRTSLNTLPGGSTNTPKEVEAAGTASNGAPPNSVRLARTGPVPLWNE